MLKFFNKDRFVFPLLMISAAIISIILKNENFYDFANYHYYNPWALLNGRIGWDIAPATVNSFLNPLLDLNTYIFLHYFNDFPNIYYSIQGIWYGLLLFSFYKIATLFFDVKSIKGFGYVWLSVVIAATGWITWTQVGSSTNEIIISMLVMAVMYWLFKIIKYPTLQNTKLFFILGLVMGSALGLKQTCISSCLASGILLIICSNRLQHPIKYVLSYAFGGLAGFLLTDGWWMYKMWVLYDNPLFPAFNGIFHSPWFDDFNFRFDAFIPPLKWAFWCPYLDQFTNQTYCHAYGEYTDMRMPFYYTIALFFLGYLMFHPQKIKQLYTQSMWFVLGVFLWLFYIFWMVFFSIQHYFIVLEMLCALPFVAVISILIKNKKISFILRISLAIILCSILISVPSNFNYGYHKRQKTVMVVEDINLPENTLIKLYGWPMGWLIPHLVKDKPNIRAVGHLQYFDNDKSKGTDFLERGKFKELRDEIEKNHKGPSVILFRIPYLNPEAYIKVMQQLQPILNGYKCRKLQYNLYIVGWPIQICVPNEWDDFK